MQEVGGAGRLSEDGCATAYKDSLNCALEGESGCNKREEAAAATRWMMMLTFNSTSFLNKKKQKKTLKTKGLDKNGYDKSKCEAFFEKYKACKTVEYEARRKARVDARRGRKKE